MAEAGILQGLPPNVATLLSEFVKAAHAAYSSDLVSVVLYGSAAKGRMRPASERDRKRAESVAHAEKGN